MKKLNNKATLIVPTTNNQGALINVDYIESELVKVAGGASTYDVKGSWVENGKVYCDTNKAIQVNYSDDQVQAVNKRINDMVYYLFTKGGQLAVSVETYDGLTIYDKSDMNSLKPSAAIVKAFK